MMMNRILAVVLITLLGFILGIGANLFYSNAVPYLTEHFPQFLAMVGTSWFIWGAIGAFIFVAASLIYAFFPEDNMRRILVVGIILLAVIDTILVYLITVR